MNEHKNIITIEDEIKEFSDKPVKSSALYKKAKELEANAVPDASEASVGDVLTKGEGGIGWETPSGGSGGVLILTPPSREIIRTDKNTLVMLCSGSEFMSAFDPTTGAMTKAIFVNVPFVIPNSQEESWENIYGLFFVGSGDWKIDMEGTGVELAFNGNDVALNYSSR